MDNQQSAVYNMAQAVVTFFAQHPTLPSSSPEMTDAHADFNSLMGQLQDAIEDQDTDTTGSTQAKANARTAAEKAILLLAEGLSALGDAKQDSVLEEEAHVAPSALEVMGDDAFSGRAQKIIDLATANVDEPAEYGITLASITTATALLSAWRGLQGRVRHAVAEGVAGTKGIARILPQISNLLEDRIDRLMRIATANNPALLDEWTAVREIVDPATQKRALTVSVTATEAGVTGPVSGTVAVINPGNVQKITGAEGMFYVQTLPPGNYTMSLSKPGYEPQTPLNFVVADGEMTTVNAVLTVDTNNQ